MKKSIIAKTLITALTLLLTGNVLKAQNDILSVRLKNHVEILASDSLEGRGLGTETMDLTREYIIRQFNEAGISPYNGKFLYPFTFRTNLSRIEGKNIIGIIEGSDPKLKNEFIVLGAHYDHLGWEMKNNTKIIYNGADDNASGTASIIEVAKAIRANNTELKRSILIIAFDAEESGLIGSKKIFEDSVLSAKEVKLMFSMDMVGMYSKNNGLDLNGIESLMNGKNIVDKVLEKKTIKIANTTGRITQRTDTKPFGDRGIPSIHLFTGTKSPYHKPEDDSNLLDYEGMAEITEFTALLTTELANTETLVPIDKLDDKSLTDKKPSKKVKTITPGFRTNLGLNNNDYPNDFFKAKAVFAAEAGVYTKIRFSNTLAIQTEVLYSYGGSKSENGNIKSHAVAVPFNIVYGTNDSRDGRFFILFGGNYNYNFAGKDGSTSYTFNGDYPRETWGINYGFGFEFNGIQFGYVFTSGLSDLNPSNADVKVISKGSYLSLGFNF